MADSHLITGLKARRASIASEIAELERQRRGLLRNLQYVDEVLKIAGFTGNPETLVGRKKSRNMFRRGQLARFVYKAEREHGADISHKDIAAIILAEMNWQDDGLLLGVIAEKVSNARKAIRRKQRIA